ncbi:MULTISPECIES: alpha/beta fold hydrolase [unclassified Nocardia]|uniref:alpha/beta fold hydrolase n=1 Tax=unclassified Nocardia TaxID=2637762 RepID=UPI001CE47B50|nr:MULTISPECIES: alpha/beta hydrolase [unclassified Nocardia]
MHRQFTIPAMAELATNLGVEVADPTPPTEFHFSRADCRLHGFDWGGTGSPVILLHGGRLTARTWDFVCLGLRRDARLVALDLRGHGESDWSDDYRIATMAADVAAAADHFGFDRIRLVGMSLGALVAAELAASRPDLVERLALIDVAPGVDFESTWLMRTFVLGLTPVQDLDTVVGAAMRINPSADRAVVTYRMSTLFFRAPDGDWVPKADPSTPDFPAILTAVEGLPAQLTGVPVLLVRGERSRVVTRTTAERLIARIPYGELVSIPDAGHNVQEDNPAALITALRDFLTR